MENNINNNFKNSQNIQFRQHTLPSISSVQLSNHYNKTNNRNNFDDSLVKLFNQQQLFDGPKINQFDESFDETVEETSTEQIDETFDESLTEQIDETSTEQVGERHISVLRNSITGEIMEIDTMPYINKLKKDKKKLRKNKKLQENYLINIQKNNRLKQRMNSFFVENKNILFGICFFILIVFILKK